MSLPAFLLRGTVVGEGNDGILVESKADAMALDCCRDKRLGCTPACTISVAIKHVYYPATVIQPGESLMLPR